MPASAWLRPLMIAALIAFIVGIIGLMLDQPRLAPIGLFIGELLTILAAIAWNTPKLPLFSETRPITTTAGEGAADAAAANTSLQERSAAEPAAATQDDAS